MDQRHGLPGIEHVTRTFPTEYEDRAIGGPSE